MFNKNTFTQKDPVAEAIKNIAEQDYKLKLEALKGDQEKLDKNKNKKLDADDFKILRGEKKAIKEEEKIEEGWDDMMKASKERREAKPSGGSGVKKGFRYGGSKQKDKPEQDDDKKKVEEATMQPKGPARSDVPAYMRRNQKPLTLADIRKRSTEKQAKKPNAVKEESEQIDELSTQTLSSYVKKRGNQLTGGYDDKKKVKGMNAALRKVAKNARKKAGLTKEEFVSLSDEQILYVFEEYMQTEEFEQLDEISKKTLSSYIGKASHDVHNQSFRAGEKYSTGGMKDMKKPFMKSMKRISGIGKAAKKLAKEEAEQIDELKKSTLASYAKKATDDVSYHSFSAGTRSPKDPGRLEDDKKAMKRQAGVGKAVDRLAKD